MYNVSEGLRWAPLLLADRDGLIVDTIAELSVAHSNLRVQFGNTALSGITGPQPFSDDPIWAVAPDGSLIVVVERPAAWNRRVASFTVTAYSDAGRVLFRQSETYNPVRSEKEQLTEYIDSEVRRLEQAAPGQIRPSAARSAIEKGVWWPSYKPPVQSVWVDNDGRIWLRRDDPLPGQQAWEVWDRAGRRLGNVEIDGPATPRAAQGSSVWSVTLDDLGVPLIVAYNMVATAKRQ